MNNFVNIYPYLEEIKKNLNELDFKSVKIGLEKGADKAINCPFVRIIQESEEYKGVSTDAIVQIVIGYDIKNDYEFLHKEFNEALYNIKQKLFTLPFKIELLNAYFDEDRLLNLKAGVLRIKIANLVEYK